MTALTSVYCTLSLPRNGAKFFTCVRSFCPHAGPVRSGLLLVCFMSGGGGFYKWRLNDLHVSHSQRVGVM